MLDFLRYIVAMRLIEVSAAWMVLIGVIAVIVWFREFRG